MIQYCRSNNSYIGPEIRLDNFEAREKKEQQHKESQQQLKQQQHQQKQEEQKRQQQQLQLQKHEEEQRLQQQQRQQLQLQLQQQQLAEQQKKQSQQPTAKGSHPPPSPAQNQHTQPPKASAWQPLPIQPPQASAWQSLPVAAETQRATLPPAPTATHLPLGGNAPHSTPTELLATQNSAPYQQLPPQGAHAPPVHPWPWNGQPPQQHPLHPYHMSLGQHQSMPVVFNPHSLPYFMPPAPHPSQLPPMPHHVLAQPPVPAPAAFQPPPTVDTASAPTPVSAPVVSAEEIRANEQLARQMMAPQPRPLPGIADESEAEEEQNEYAPLYSYEGQPLIMVKKTAPAYPAVMVNERDGALVVKISLFGLSVAVQRNGQLIYVRLREAAEVKNALFTLPLLHAMPTSNGIRLFMPYWDALRVVRRVCRACDAGHGHAVISLTRVVCMPRETKQEGAERGASGVARGGAARVRPIEDQVRGGADAAHHHHGTARAFDPTAHRDHHQDGPLVGLDALLSPITITDYNSFRQLQL